MTLLRRARSGRDSESGQIFPIALTLAIGIIAVSMLFMHAGRAGLLSTRTQGAADSAALAAAEAVRDDALANLANGIVRFSNFELAESEARAAAEEFAERNNAELVSIEPVGGFVPRGVEVTVRSEENVGGGIEEIKDSKAETTAYASVDFPGCYPGYVDRPSGPPLIQVYCDDEIVASYVSGNPIDLTSAIGPLIETRLHAEAPSIPMLGGPAVPGNGGPISRDKMVNRAGDWMVGWGGGPVPYSMYGSYWNGYRRDCSAFISYAWGLPGPGLTTSTLPQVSHPIPKSELKKGDILLKNNGLGGASHVVMFLKWKVPGESYYAIHQTPPHTTKEVLTYPYPGDSAYEPYRYNKVTG